MPLSHEGLPLRQRLLIRLLLGLLRLLIGLPAPVVMPVPSLGWLGEQGLGVLRNGLLRRVERGRYAGA